MARTIWRLLSFRLTPAEFAGLGRAHLAVGLALAWAVGYGRWWDRPDQVAPLLRSGLVSVFLALGLGVVLGGFLTALRPPRGGLVQVCAFVALTAPPAAVYALPLERWLDLEVARALNVASLAVVATWRVALVVWMAWRLAGLRAWEAALTTLTPLALTVLALMLSGLLLGVYRIMAGDAEPPTTAETRYEVIAALGTTSLVVGPLALVAWGWARFRRVRAAQAPPR